MLLLWLLGAVVQCALLIVLWHSGKRAVLQQTPPAPPLAQWPPRMGGSKTYLPKIALFIPAAGDNPAMPEALRSLLRQDYPELIPVIITATADDPATALVQTLQQEFPTLRHVLAGPAVHCGQKNHNLLQGIAAIKDQADIYVFSDSTHTARPDFVQQLVWPIVCGESAFTTGYHRVVAQDNEPVTLAYQICVLLMRLLQAVAVFTQPWGGAMAMRRQAYERYDIGQFWSTNVVDDCSLAALLMARKLSVRQTPHALLDTPAAHHKCRVWAAWMDRQVLFLKFCIPSQWLLLGVLACCMTVPPLVSVCTVLGSAVGLLPPSAAWCTLGALAHLAVLIWAQTGWRQLTGHPPAPLHLWLAGFALASGMFAWVYCRSLNAHSIDWHGFRYVVGRQGRVEHRTRL